MSAEKIRAYNNGFEDGQKSLTTVSHDPVNHPKHYTNHPSGVECIQITRHMGFNLGNAIKYIWRADLKNDAIEDLEKAVWYIRDEIEKRKNG
jgi:hypothetical protein